MNVKQIVIQHLKAIGADGLCAEDCGCGVDDLMPCVYASYGDCKPAKAVPCDGTCSNCEFSEEGNPDEVCYRPMETQTAICGNPATGVACQNESSEKCGDCLALLAPTKEEETHL